MKPELILIGGGGHCKSCIDVIEHSGNFHIAGIVDIPEKLNEKVVGYKIIATDQELPYLVKEYHYFLVTVGQIESPDKRMMIFHNLKTLGARLPVVVSPLSYVSPHALIGEGTIVMHHAIINVGTKVGKNCIINTKALLEHDAQVDDHCHISTGAIINGEVKIKSGTFFGSYAVCRESIEIGENSFIGFGEKIFNNLPPRSVIKTK